jgi:hypothetical protein
MLEIGCNIMKGLCIILSPIQFGIKMCELHDPPTGSSLPTGERMINEPSLMTLITSDMSKPTSTIVPKLKEPIEAG